METREMTLLDGMESDCCQSGVLESTPNICASCLKSCMAQCEECGGTGIIKWEAPNYRGDDMEQHEQVCIACKGTDEDRYEKLEN